MKIAIRTFIVVGVVAGCVYMTQVSSGGFLLRKSQVPKAIQDLKSGTAKEKETAARELGKLGAVRVQYVEKAIPVLVSAAVKEKEAGVRGAAIEALGRIGRNPKKTVVLLRSILKKKDEEVSVKTAAMIAIGRMGAAGKAAMPDLVKIARDKEGNKKMARTARMVVKSLRSK